MTEENNLAFDLASWVHQQNRLGTKPRIDTQTVHWMRTFPRPNIQRRVELYLEKVIDLLNGKLNGMIRPDDPALRVASWSFSGEDAIALAQYLVELGALRVEKTPYRWVVTAKAHIIYDEMTGKRAISTQAFVAMWFQESIKDAYNSGFAKAITDAGYEPFRIDRKEYEEKIDDEIIAEIRRSAFLIADFTGHRGGVYYEAGFAHGLGKRVIFTCKSDDLDNLHFDVRQYNTIKWNTPSEIVAPLQNRILALFGAGPLKPDAKPIPTNG
ncbi:MAG: hypothetical protein ACREE4_18525 [Stellaceae bacterium]